MMLHPPHIYADWVKCIELLLDDEQNEEEILKVIHQGTIEWVPGVSERFIKLVNEVINDRFDKSIRKLRQDLDRANGAEHLLVPALIAERKRSEFVVRFVMIPAIPREQKKRFLEAIDEAIIKLQKNLESSARQNDSSGKLFSVVNRNPVTVEIPELPEEDSAKEPSFYTSFIRAVKMKK